MNSRLFKIMESKYIAKLEEAKYKLELLTVLYLVLKVFIVVKF